MVKTEKSRSAKILTRLVFVLLAIFVLFPAVLLAWWLISNRSNGKIISSGEVRRYLVYVPATYTGDESVPLVINIHGFAQWPANQMRVSRWNELADRDGFIVVYPMGTRFPLRWRVPGGSAETGGSEKEITFFTDLIEALEKQYNIDVSRIYASGLSNGGGMSMYLACKLSDRIAAVGSVAGAYTFEWSACQPGRPVPAIFFHGKADSIVPYHGGTNDHLSYALPDVPTWIQTYARGNDCDLNPLQLAVNGAVNGMKYPDCKQSAEVIFYTINDGGHTWPGGSPLPEWITGKTSTDIEATLEMWQFFQQHPLVP